MPFFFLFSFFFGNYTTFTRVGMFFGHTISLDNGTFLLVEILRLPYDGWNIFTDVIRMIGMKSWCSTVYRDLYVDGRYYGARNYRFFGNLISIQLVIQ
jgi:hypothetical protein